LELNVASSKRRVIHELFNPALDLAYVTIMLVTVSC